MSRGRTAILVVLSVLVFITLGLQGIVSFNALFTGRLYYVEVFAFTSLFLALEVGLLTVLVASLHSSLQDMQLKHKDE